ncbi:AAA family ATPase [Streptomyces xanthophaeus]|uniref:AAA family ATPase n=1 Tax=Streptomyces xanthophaeus TaxID=67385 RepID=UPI00371E0E3F
MDPITINGFEIGGFRSFFGAPQRIHPLSKITILAGPNNSGKSNVFRFAEKWFGTVVKNGGAAPLGPLDVPIMPVGVDPPIFSFGFSIPIGDPASFLEQVIPIRREVSVPVWENLIQLVHHPSLLDSDTGSLWLRYQVNGVNVEPDGEVLKKLSEDFRKVDRLVNEAALRASHASTDLLGNLHQLVSRLGAPVRIPKVVVIPAFREIVSDGSPNPELARLDGHGLPGFLHALHSPSAERYRSDSQKFQKINRFLQTVLEDDSAQIAIPYNSQTVHVSVGDRVLPIESLGAGISQVVMLAAAATWHDDALVCIEEPEVHLHPILLRKLVHYLESFTSNQYILSTHASSLMDNPNSTVLAISYDHASGTSVRVALTESQRAQVAQHLGYRASDILQSNSVIWVEGPSDRIYVNHWLRLADPRLIEGIHYSVMFYGGKLLSHLSGAEYIEPSGDVEDFISLLKINRRMAIIIDSDLKQADGVIRSAKTRIIREFAESGGFSWVTSGREIENYVPHAEFSEAATSRHGSARPAVPSDRFSDRFSGIKKVSTDAPGVRAPDKVGIALAAIEDSESVWDELDLVEKVNELAQFIRLSNHLQL